jgi:hypothetical protein
VLQEDLTLLAMEKTEHGCTLKLTGVCKTCESYEKMHEEIEYEVLIIQQMGRTIVPPKRPRHIPRYTPLTEEMDNFTWISEMHVFLRNGIVLRGHTRKDQNDTKILNGWLLFSHKFTHITVTSIGTNTSVEWRMGGGDEWFQEEDDKHNKWQTEERDSRICTMRWDDLVSKLLGSL